MNDFIKSLKLPNSAFQGQINNVKVYLSQGQNFVQVTANYESLTYIYSIPKDKRLEKRLKVLLNNIGNHIFESHYLQEGVECSR